MRTDEQILKGISDTIKEKKSPHSMLLMAIVELLMDIRKIAFKAWK